LLLDGWATAAHPRRRLDCAADDSARIIACRGLPCSVVQTRLRRSLADRTTLLLRMRAPKRKRPMRHTLMKVAPDIDLEALAARARYVGSSEHKSFPSFAGNPKLRADASKCDPSLTDPDEITEWLREGIEDGLIGAPWEGEFPRYVWRVVDGVCYAGRLVNRDAGTYKGYPLDADEGPEGV
jgi:hypothetical protein